MISRPHPCGAGNWMVEGKAGTSGSPAPAGRGSCSRRGSRRSQNPQRPSRLLFSRSHAIWSWAEDFAVRERHVTNPHEQVQTMDAGSFLTACGGAAETPARACRAGCRESRRVHLRAPSASMRRLASYPPPQAPARPRSGAPDQDHSTTLHTCHGVQPQLPRRTASSGVVPPT